MYLCFNGVELSRGSECLSSVSLRGKTSVLGSKDGVIGVKERSLRILGRVLGLTSTIHL